jgi:hypothetical protein
LWTVPNGCTITSGQGTNSIVVNWTNVAIQNGISGNVCVKGVDSCAESNFACIPLEFQVAAPVTPPSISGPSKNCVGDIATFSFASVARASSYIWTLPSGVTILSGQGTNIITVEFTGGYIGGSLKVKGSNICGNSPNRTKALSLNAPYAPSVITGVISGLCNSSGVTYSIAPVINADSYVWNVGTATIVSGAGTNAILVNFGNFNTNTITVKAINNCGESTTRSLSVSGKPAQSSAIANVSNLICTNSISNYSVSTVVGAVNYNWIISIGGIVTAGQGTKNVTVQWSNTGYINQSVSVSTSNGCGTSPIRTVGGITTYNCSKVDDGSESFQLLVYPNPAQEIVNVQFYAEAEGEYIIRLIDNIGRTLISKTGNATNGVNTSLVNTEGIAKGVYHVSIVINEKQQQIILLKN